MGTVIDSKYELIEKIGSGGGGIVYLANHLRLNKKVVLKADKRELTTRPEILRREVDVLKNLSHTYIPQVYDFFSDGETVYTVMDFIEGESLDKPLKKGKCFSQPQVIKWACQLLSALCYLHNPIHGEPPHGIVHSDIKPANIMLTPLGNICLIDFNIALAIGEENVVGLSPGYASPEHYGLDFSSDRYIDDTKKKDTVNEPTAQKTSNKNASGKEETETATMLNIRQNDETVTMSKSLPVSETMTMAGSEDIIEKVTMSPKHTNKGHSSKRVVVPDARSDIYSLGATLYHLLSGVRPARSAKDVIPLSEKDFSPLIVHIISKAMNPNPDLRYQTAEEMLYDFTHLRENDYRTVKLKKLVKITSGIAAVLFLSGIFVSFTGLKRTDSVQKSLTLAEYSKNELDLGNRDKAIEYALEALPKAGLFTPIYTAEAQKALADATGVYDLSDGFKPHRIIELPAETFKVKLSPDGKTGVAVYSFAVAVFDTKGGEITATLPTVKSALADVVFTDNDTIAYGGENGLTVYNVKSNKTLWTGKPATHIAVSADGQVVAGIYRDESFATVYDINGNEKTTISFNGNKQRVIDNDILIDPMDNLMALNNDGRYLAVSFANGGLMIYDTKNINDSLEVYDKSDFTHFEGGFNGQYFAYSATKEGLSDFNIIDVNNILGTVGFSVESLVGVKTDENAIYLSNKSVVVTINPVTGEQKEVAYIDSDVDMFAVDNENTIVSTKKYEYLIYDKDAELINRYNGGQIVFNYVDIAGNYAVVAGSDTPVIKILKKESFENSEFFAYDNSFSHSESRISEDGSRVMLFDYKAFLLYDINSNVINQVSIPNADEVYDQQYVKKSGNLAVMYKDAFRLYSGTTGDLIYEDIDDKFVIYTSYGVSVLDKEGVLKLIDLNTGDIIASEKVEGNYAIYCGKAIDDEILQGAKPIGGGKIQKGYFCAAVKGDVCFVYDENGNKRFEIPVSDNTEAFFIDNKIILSPMHGTPVVYNINTGKKAADLEKDSYLTYITPVDNYILTEYVSVEKGRYGILVDKINYKALAYMPDLVDVSNDELVFDYQKGKLRKTKVYDIDDLINTAKR